MRELHVSASVHHALALGRRDGERLAATESWGAGGGGGLVRLAAGSTRESRSSFEETRSISQATHRVGGG